MRPAKAKTIKKVIQAKIDDWLSSLPSELSEAIKGKIVVSGGCVVSMLKGEPINDFDLYFHDNDTAIKVAKHYAAQSNLSVEVIEEVGVNIKEEEETRVINYVSSAGVAGDNPDEVDEAAEWKEETQDQPEPEKYRLQFISRNAITLSGRIQIITRFTGTAEEIHRNFDFVHATCSYDTGSRELSLPNKALQAVLANELIYTGSLYPIATIFRVKKFLGRGWNITAGELLKIMWQISEVDMTDPKTLIDQLTGVDAAYMQTLIEALSGAEPDKINSCYVTTIINRIFNGE